MNASSPLLSPPRRVVIDTDCGTDDLIAIALLASRPDIELIAITTVHGLTRALQGADNVRRILHRLGKPHVPVFSGSEVPISGVRQFPDEWRVQTETLSGVHLPALRPFQQTEAAHQFLAEIFRHSAPTTIFALGPWTNVAIALRSWNRSLKSQVEILSMGGAIDSPGNVFAESIGSEIAPNAEWNFYLDPVAVNEVLSCGFPVTLVPLDATKEAAITPALVKGLRESPKTEALNFVIEIIQSVDNWINEGHYFAWDVVAAVLLIYPNIGTRSLEKILVQTEGFDAGRVRRSAGGYEVSYFSSIDAARFEKLLIEGLS